MIAISELGRGAAPTVLQRGQVKCERVTKLALLPFPRFFFRNDLWNAWALILVRNIDIYTSTKPLAEDMNALVGRAIVSNALGCL